jgi:hypothetical protein
MAKRIDAIGTARERMTAGLTNTADSTNEETDQRSVAREDIAALAYAYWRERGCPDGSPEEDWFRAEQELASPERGMAAAA